MTSPQLQRLVASLRRVAATPASVYGMAAFPERAAVALILRRSQSAAGAGAAHAPDPALELLFIKRAARRVQGFLLLYVFIRGVVLAAFIVI